MKQHEARAIGNIKKAYLDVFGSVGILERVVRVVEVHVGGVDVGDHDQTTPPLQRSLQQVGQLAVAVLHIRASLSRRFRFLID